MTTTIVLNRGTCVGPCYRIPKKWEKLIHNAVMANVSNPEYAWPWQKCSENYWPILKPCLKMKGVFYYPVGYFVIFDDKDQFSMIGCSNLGINVVFDDQFIFDYSQVITTETQIDNVNVKMGWGTQNIFNDPDVKNMFIQLVKVVKKAGCSEMRVRPSYDSDNPNEENYNCVDVRFIRTKQKFSASFTGCFRIKPVSDLSSGETNLSTIEQRLMKAWKDTLDEKIAKTEETVNEYIKKLKKLRSLRAKA